MANGSRDVAQNSGKQQLTGRVLLLGRQINDPALPKMLRDRAGLRIASSSDFPRGTIDAAGLAGSDGVYFERLGVAVASSAPDQVAPLAGPTGTAGILAIEPERVVYAFQIPRPDVAPVGVPARIGQFGPRSVDALVCSLLAPALLNRARQVDESTNTWGLVSTGVLDSSRTGRGIRVAVLDSGIDLQHPDFAGRQLVTHSFIDGETVQDVNSHGTHCIGTALGSAKPPSLPRYGIAAGTEIYAGKVLSNAGSGADGGILGGINWALENGCRVVSMSLGAATQRGQRHSDVYEAVAQRALAQNTIIIAAGGNESDRPKGVINPVGHPANCPSIMAVGAVDSDLQIAWFSVRGTEPDGGGIDIVGPGVDIYSTVPLPDGHGRKNGTSMACPHVAGIAALYFEANPNATAKDVWQLLVRNAKPLEGDPADMGAGLAQAPR